MSLADIEISTLAWLLLLAVILIAGLSMVWSTVRTGMSPMPSSRSARRGVLTALEHIGGGQPEQPIVDLGSGWGHLAIAVARRYPDCPVRGYELALLPWLVSVLIARALRQHNLTFLHQDFLAAAERGQLGPVHTALTYLHGPGMARLSAALTKHPGQLNWLISNNFALPDWQPERQWQLRDFYRSPLYLYALDRVKKPNR